MAGTVVNTATAAGSGITKYSMAWTSDAAGAVNGTSTTHTYGSIIAVTFLPGAGGSAPTNLYDITIVCDTHGVDILNDEGANLSGTLGSHHSVFSFNADKTAYFRQFLHAGSFTLNVTNAGDTKSGLVEMYVSHGIV